ncbi:MAG: transglutaminase N-terminal domain-containing protein, partial [Cyanobacteria bacterium J06598_3]
MRYRITHQTQYRYSTGDRTPAAVKLKPHVLRLTPRNDGAQWLEQFDVQISPTPTAQHYFYDVCGNTCLQVTFASAITD